MTELNRIDLADIHIPEQLAGLVLDMLGSLNGAAPVVEVARALDISTLRIDRFDGFEGMLLTDRRRSDGVILANNAHGYRRARFTVAHELGHFLMERHEPSATSGFQCTSSDLSQRRGAQQHYRQEAEANRFAIELLAPRASFANYLKTDPDLDHVREAAQHLDLSKEATARRYRELHGAITAMVFHQKGVLRYVDKADEFPQLSLRKEAPLPPSLSAGRPAGTLTDILEADPKDWFDGPPGGDLMMQTLFQNNGVAITLLTLGR